jgi:hypothetical protein
MDVNSNRNVHISMAVISNRHHIYTLTCIWAIRPYGVVLSTMIHMGLNMSTCAITNVTQIRFASVITIRFKFHHHDRLTHSQEVADRQFVVNILVILRMSLLHKSGYTGEKCDGHLPNSLLDHRRTAVDLGRI